jgi:hypothetical protein
MLIVLIFSWALWWLENLCECGNQAYSHALTCIKWLGNGLCIESTKKLVWLAIELLTPERPDPWSPTESIPLSDDHRMNRWVSRAATFWNHRMLRCTSSVSTVWTWRIVSLNSSNVHLTSSYPITRVVVSRESPPSPTWWRKFNVKLRRAGQSIWGIKKQNSYKFSR